MGPKHGEEYLKRLKGYIRTMGCDHAYFLCKKNIIVNIIDINECDTTLITWHVYLFLTFISVIGFHIIINRGLIYQKV